MLVYLEELRVALADKSSSIGSKTSIAFKGRKTGTEWEILGNLALRLHSPFDAKQAFTLCLDQMHSTSALLNLIAIYSAEGQINPTLELVVRMVNCLERTYSEDTYPSPIATSLFILVGQHGLTKVQNALVAMNVNSITYRHIT